MSSAKILPSPSVTTKTSSWPTLRVHLVSPSMTTYKPSGWSPWRAIRVPASSLISSAWSWIQASFSSGSRLKSGTERRQSRTRSSGTSDLPQVLVDELDGDGALADGGGAALDRAVAHVPSDEDAWHARLQQERVPIWSPALGTLPILHQIRPREDKATLVALNDAVEPPCLRRRPDKDEQGVCREGLRLAGHRILRGYPLQVILTLHGDHACVEKHLDIVSSFDLAHQVVGHALPQVVAPVEDEDLARLVCEEHRGLTGRVRTSDDEYVLALAREGLCLGRAVVDATSREALDTRSIQFLVGDTGRDDQGIAGDLRPVGEGHDAVSVLHAYRAHLLGRQDLDIESSRLVDRPPCEVAARKPGREAEIVLDAAAGSRLPAGGFALYKDGLQTL